MTTNSQFIVPTMGIELFHCKICGEGFWTENTFHSHRDNHPNNPLKCLLCDEFITGGFTAKSHLTWVHAIPKPVICRCCDWAFREVSDCRGHKKFLRGSANNTPLPLVINAHEPGLFHQNGYLLDGISKHFLRMWQLNAIVQVHKPNHPIATDSSLQSSIVENNIEETDTPSPTLASPNAVSSEKKKEKGFMIKDILDLND
ncbi:hypothetical protein GCK72_009263 [Caenorhabditis remanei]|uniref:C2H2-type domain-containing protein n=1 Tax=Caenorhabditis remanei TaxID=31234 RepID=A0A6A5GZR6_CAERE|nr:hypothetical protein GCK72_009263 [Caenorhabditis remanei]KAF1761010.1 hypothetical protein GCK72_009263 [Caenorhabditis remanei]